MTHQNLKARNLETLKACDLCIICAKPEETQVLVREFSLETKISGDLVDGAPPTFDFHIGEFALGGCSMAYYLTHPSRQGIQTFGIEVAALFSILKPKYAVHVGVCAAILEQGIDIEDVIFGERALNYEEGKWAIEGGKQVFKPDIQVVTVKCATMGGFLTKANQSIYKCGDFISGCSVRMDASFIFDRVQKGALRNVAALDMEASAFLQACEFTGVKSLGVIKGVSDMGDGNKVLSTVKNHYRPALEHAARATERFVSYRWRNLPPREARDRSHELGCTLTDGYFDNFIMITMEKLKNSGFNILLANTKIKVKGIRIVLPEMVDTKPEVKDSGLYNVASFDAKTSALSLLVEKFGLQQVILGEGGRPIVYLKGSYVVDPPTTLASNFAEVQGRNEQINLFRETLETKIAGYMGFVQVITWEDFKKLCEEEGIAGSVGTDASV